MEVLVVKYDPDLFSDELYQRALLVLDPESSARIRRFYRREDACRTLIGRFLPRILLHRRGIQHSQMRFSATATGKPFITNPTLDPPLAYNVSHDNGLIAIVASPNCRGPPAFSLGIDVMKVRIPPRDTLASFVEMMGDQLSALEKRLISSAPTEQDGLERFFWMWTAKEAYTKALGLGLGFDFSRVEFDPLANTLRVDGATPLGWSVDKFRVIQDNDLYFGVVAEWHTECSDPVVVRESDELPAVMDAHTFINHALQNLNT